MSLLSSKSRGDAERGGEVVGSGLAVDGVEGVDGIRVGSPLGFRGLKPVTLGPRWSPGEP